MSNKRIISLLMVLSLFFPVLSQPCTVFGAEDISFESCFDTAQDREKTFPVANGKNHPVTYEAGLGGKASGDYAIKMTAQRTDTQDTSSAELNPAFELPYFPFSTFGGAEGQIIEASVLYGGDVSSAKIDCFMNTTASFSSGNKALYTFIEIKDGTVFVLGNDTGIACQKDEWLDFVIEEHNDISDLKIFINGKKIKTELAGHSIYGNRWTQAKITFDEATAGTGYIAFDNVKIYRGDYIADFSHNGIELYVNGENTNQYSKAGDVLSAKVDAYGEKNEEAMLALAVYGSDGTLEAVHTDIKQVNEDTGYSVSYTLERSEDIDIKAFFWNAENLLPYSETRSFVKGETTVYCNYMLDTEQDFTFVTDIGTKNSIAYQEETVNGAANGFVRFTRNSTDRFYAFVEPGRTQNNVVISADIRTNSSSPPFKFTFGDGLSYSGTLFTSILQINAGKINNTYPLNENSWNTVAVAINLDTKKADIYLNGNKVSSNIGIDSRFNYLTQFRFECVASSVMGYFDADNIRIYQATAPIDIGNQKPVSFNRFDATDNAAMYLSGKRAVQTYSNTAFDGKQKKKLTHECINYDDEVLLPEDAFGMLFNKSVSVDGNKITVSDGTVLNVGSMLLTKVNSSTRRLTVPPEIHDGIAYIPAVAYANATLSSTSFVDDGHGMLITGNGLDKADGRMKKANLYLFFDRKTPEQLKEQLSNNTSGLTQHPRLMLNAGDIARLKAECITRDTRDSYKYSWYKKVKSEADALITAKPYTYYLSGGRLRNVANGAAYRLETLSFMYLLTGQKMYANRAISELESVCGFPDWGVQGSYLDTAALATGAALAYDWLYNYMTPEQRETFAVKIQELSVKPARQAYECKATFNDFFWNTETNWGIIANGGVANAILATAEYNTEECMTTLNYSLRAMENTWYRFAPDGAWYEGPGYWSYMLGYLAKFMACYESSMGENFAANYRGLDKYGYFQCYFMGPDGLPNNFHDSDLENVQSEGQFFLAKIYGDDALMRYRRMQMEKYTEIFPLVEDILWYDVSASDNSADIKLDKVSYFRETELVSIRENWTDENSAWLSFHGGKVNGAHDHIDSGTFVYCIGGERWAVDLGKEPLRYSNPDPAGLAGYTIQNYYRARAEGHNCIVINPAKALEMEADSNSKVSVPVEKNGCIFSTVDLSSAYSSKVNSYVRGFKMSDNLRTLTVRDEISLKSASSLYWFMHTDGDINIADNNTALITKNGKTLKVQVASNADYVLSAQKAEPMPTSPIFEMTENAGVTKLALKLNGASGNVNITVKMSLEEEIGSSSGVDTAPISSW